MARFTSYSLIALWFSFAARSVLAITIPTVPVGDLGNPNDPATGNLYGGVTYAYNIGKFEVTVGQYTAFLNAVAATDTYALYSLLMQSNANIAGISRSGTWGSYTYDVIGSADHPVTYVSWGDAARFVNWLNNGQPTGTQDAATTEDGAYTLNGATTNAELLTVTRNAGAQWFIPTESEWYKAAYYQPTTAGGDVDGYWLYPMKTNSEPISAPPSGTTPDKTRAGNFYLDDRSANGYDDGYAVTLSTNLNNAQNYLTDVGAYTASPTYYGTFDQAGNVWEWNEAVVSTFNRGARGGAWVSQFDLALRATHRLGNSVPSMENNAYGFRVASTASVPEPCGSTLFSAYAIILGLRDRRRRASLRLKVASSQTCGLCPPSNND